MRIEAGKTYKTRDGCKAGPMRSENDGLWFRGDVAYPNGIGRVISRDRVWRPDGVHDFAIRDLDLIAEWSDGPVRTVTRKEIVPGTYGLVEIAHEAAEGVSVWLPRNKLWNAAELRAAAATFIELADALEQQP